MTDAPRTTASSIAVEWVTTGTASLPSRPLVLRSAGSAAEPVSSRGINCSTERFCAASTRSRPSSESDRLRFKKFQTCARLNPRTHTPFGLGRLEVAFSTINDFLDANRYAARLASNSVAQYALWLNEATPEQHDRLIRWWQDEIEGTGKVPILSCEQKPEVLRFAGGTDADLRLQWQEFLLRILANAFDLPPMLLGLQSDVNRSTAGELADEAFRSAIVPVARLLAEHISRDLFAKRLGWREFEFVFNDLESRDEMQELQIQTELLKAGVLTIDEVREQRGLPRLAPSTE